MRRFLPLLVLVALVAGACSTAGGAEIASLEDAADVPSTDTSLPEELDTETALLEFAQCMRDNGLPDFEDPTVDEDGFPRIFRGGEGAGPVDFDTMEQAMDACSEHLERIRLGFDRPDESERQDQRLAMAQCLRDAGYDVDDPDFSGEPGARRGWITALDPTDPEVQADLEGCMEEAGFTPGGPGAGPGGGPGPGGPRP